MQFFENNEIISPIYHRAICLSISKDFAHSQKGEIFVAKFQDSEQAHSRRELLEVEQRANKEKIIEQHGNHQFQAEVSDKLLEKVSLSIVSEFNNKDSLFSQILNIEAAACDILELLAVNAASIKRITPLVNSLPWLADDLINLVNKPQYRKRSDVKVSEASLAVSYIGLDNLRMVMPTFILKHWLPTSTAPFGAMKKKLWQDSLAIAMASKILANNAGIDEYQAFTAGILSNIGILAVSRTFSKIYTDIHQLELKKAYDKRDKRLHDALSNIKATPELLLELLSAHNSKVAAEMVELMRFDRLNITEAIFDLSFNDNKKKMCQLAQIILKAKAFVVFRCLAKDELIDADESKSWLGSVGLTSKEIAQLNRADIDHIKLNFS
ncbi:MAG: HDOD domain-containing protein [Thalassotalea sp.]